MKNQTVRYVRLNENEQVKVVLTHQQETSPAPHDEVREREVTADELEAVTGMLSARDFSNVSIF